MELTRDNVVKVVRTSLLVAAWFCMGMRLTLHFATIPDQRSRLNTTTDKMSYAFALGGLGSFAGPPLSALSDRFQNHADLYFSGLLGIFGLMFALKPCITQLWIYALFEVLESVVMSVCSPVGYSLIMAMWGKHAHPAVQIFGLGWSFGGVFGPLIAVPFVSVQAENDTTTNINSILDYFALDPYDSTSSRVDRYPDDSRIEIAFWIVSLCFIVVASLFVVMYICVKPQAIGPQKSYTWKEILYPKKWADGDRILGIKVFVLYVLAFICYTGTYYGPSTFLATYASDSKMFDNQEAALLTSAYSLCGSTGRIIVIFVSKWLKPTPLLAILTHCTCLGALFMTFVGTQSNTGLWVSACTFALFYRPIWGALYTWTNDYIILLAAILGVQGFINSIAGIFISSLQGFLYEITIESIFYTTVTYSSLLCIVYYFMVGVGWGRQTRHDKVSKKAIDVFVVPSDKNKCEKLEQEKSTDDYAQLDELTYL